MNRSPLTPPAQRLRREMTREERHLWYDFLKGLPLTVRRQKVIGPYIVDFYCHEAKLIIELDGSQHYEEAGLQKDAQRTEYLKGYDVTVIRIPNNYVNENFEGVCQYIDLAVQQSLSQPAADSSLCAREPFENAL